MLLPNAVFFSIDVRLNFLLDYAKYIVSNYYINNIICGASF